MTASGTARTRASQREILEKAPPGWEGTVKRMKKHPEIDNPFALAWSMKNKGDTPGGKKEADGYVAPRYDKSHPEGFVSPEYPDMKSGVEAKPKKAWTERQRDMHVDLGKQIARESRRTDSGPVIINSDPEHPATLPYSRPKREDGWRGGIAFSPPVKRLRESASVVIKEF